MTDQERKIVIECVANEDGVAQMNPEGDSFFAYVVEAPAFVWHGGGVGVGEDVQAPTRDGAVSEVKDALRRRYSHLALSFFEEHR